MSGTNRYYGIYRGTVINNIDPMQIARIMVSVPDVGGITPSTWAMPCVPISGKQMGTFMVPQIGSGVWVQFEGGDPDFPVWTVDGGAMPPRSLRLRWRESRATRTS
jgi:Type VI secretion system/phage-baseplate injector OB domain